MDEDRKRWDEKWAQMGADHLTPAPLLVRYTDQLNGGRALDLACGVGRNALWLAAHGYTVDAIDISPVGLALGRAEAKRRGLTINFVKADLDDYVLPIATYDLVAVFRFLNRRLLPAIGDALRPGGWLFYESLDLRYLELKPDTLRDYLLTPGELETAFAHLRLIEASPNPSRQTSFLVAQASGQPQVQSKVGPC
jgi:SAM-dependent methyltransferase